MARRQKTYLDFLIRPNGFVCDFQKGVADNEPAAKLMAEFLVDKNAALYDISFKEPEQWYSPSLMYLHTVGSAFVNAVSRTPDLEVLRDRAAPDVDAVDLRKLASRAPFIPGSEFIDSDWVSGIWNDLLEVYRREVSAFDGTVELYLAGKNQNLRIPGRIFFHLVENPSEGCFAFIATYSSTKDGRLSHHPLGHALKEYKDDRKRMLTLLSYLSEAADRSEFISSLIESGELFHALRFDREEAYTFLKEVPIYESAGIVCRIPNWWKRRNSHGLNVEALIGDQPSLFGAESLLSVTPSVSVDGIPLTEAEIRDLIELGNGLAFIKGRWIEVDREKLQQALDLMDRLSGSTDITMAEAMRMSLGIDKPEGMEEVEFSNGRWLDEMLLRMKEASFDPPEIPDSFHGELRPYQARGVGWISQLSQLGFGACLADDMGLGKTVQVIAYLEHVRATRGGRHLLVVPASLLGNWNRELEKFAPSMSRCTVHSGAEPDPGAFLTITTYGMVRTKKALSEMRWDTVIVDEAQAIKNPSSQQTKAIKSLDGRFKLAMTGTPVENGLMDLWSIFDFIDRGLLGSQNEFKSFTDGVGDNPDLYSRLREMTAPFILRRLKTDRRIIDDLPDKNEIDVSVSLTKKQAVLYSNYMDQFERNLGSADKGQRLGLVLSAITKFKQICDHPDLYVGEGDYDEKSSGKFVQLRQICETIRDNGERVLVFTQYRELTGPLSDFLEKVFGRKGLVLHGGTSAKKRSEMVERFNSEDDYIPYMVLSLKAGGVGLNLTAANHVVHFDRWWNPAVENQATDRAFRIGQRKDVMVYRLISQGTIEDKIAELIERKTAMAEKIVGEGENWITELDDRQLVNLFRLE